MNPGQLLVPSGLLLASAASPWLLHFGLRGSVRPDGSPSPGLVRSSELLNAVFALALVVIAVISRGSLVVLGHAWRHDLWSALLIGALAGLFLHVVGSGSPLPVASVRPARRPTDADAVTILLLVLGEAGAVLIWFGAGLPSLLRLLPRLMSLPVVAAGYGLSRAAAGQDHPLLGAIDGLLLGLLYLLSGSLLAVLVAHFVVDLLAYVSVIRQAEEAALASDAGEPVAAWSPTEIEESGSANRDERLVELDGRANFR